MKAYLELIKIDLKLALRLRTVIFFNYLFPMIFFFTFGSVLGARNSLANTTLVVTMSLTLGVLGNGLFGAGIRALQERELNILRRYKVTPITAGPLLVASMVTGWMIFMPYIVLLLTLSHFIYHMPWPQHMASLLVFISLGLVAFRSIGLVVASVANNMQEGTILVQLLYFPMLFLSGATIPTRSFGPALQVISEFIPATYLVKGVQGIMLQGNWLWDVRTAAGAMIVTMFLGWFVGMKLFRWEKEEKIRASAKLWVLAVLVPFFVMGAWKGLHRERKQGPAVKGDITTPIPARTQGADGQAQLQRDRAKQ
jgi:ABC-2 type transport system permease protein